MEKNNSKILALKYRPRIFKDLIGQEIIAQTISNAIKINKTPNAYLLTGIRGVGKTTTARLIAKALNCTKNFETGEMCSEKENAAEHFRRPPPLPFCDDLNVFFLKIAY